MPTQKNVLTYGFTPSYLTLLKLVMICLQLLDNASLNSTTKPFTQFGGMTLVLLLVHGAAIAYFIAIKALWFALLPILGFAWYVVLATHTGTAIGVRREHITAFFTHHAYAFAWCCSMLGIWGMSDIYGFDSVSTGMRFVWTNIVLWIGSYLLEYKEGKHMFHVGYFASSFLTLWALFALPSGPAHWVEIIMLWVSLTMALYAFFVFVLGAVGIPISRNLSYPLFVTIHVCIMYLIYYYANHDTYLSLVLAQVYLSAVYCLIRWIHRYSLQVTSPQQPQALFKHVLSGRRIATHHQGDPMRLDMVLDAHAFLRNLDGTTKFVISLFNIILIVAQIWYFVWGYGGYGLLWTEILLWFGIIVFFVNYLLLRAIHFYHGMQRAVAFLLINFGIYFTAGNIFGADLLYLMTVGMIWSMLNSLAIFHANYFSEKGIFDYTDFLYRIGANVLSSLVNLYLLFFLPLSLQMRFSLAALYFGIQFFLLLSNVRHIQKAIR